MKTVLTLILFLIIGIAGSKGWVSRVRAGSPVAGLFITGIEFFFVGVLLGPSFLDVISRDALADLKPLVYLALGWTGLLFGIQMSWLQLRRVSRSVFRTITLDSFLTTIVFTAVFYVLFGLITSDIPRSKLLCGSFVSGITASISSPTIIAVLSRTVPARGRFTSTAKLVSSLNPIIPLFMFGMLFIISHPNFLGEMSFSSGLLWWIFSNLIGIILGFVMVLLSTQRCTEDERMLLIIGIVMLVGGACFYLGLSTLYTAMVMGITVGNFSPRKDQIFKQLLQLEKSIYIVFLILVGAMPSISNAFPILVAAGYIVLRLLLKALLSRHVLLGSFPELKGAGKLCGMVFVSQGGIALAMVLDFRLTIAGPLADLVASSIVLAVVGNEIIGFYLTRVALQGSGEVGSILERSLGTEKK